MINSSARVAKQHLSPAFTRPQDKKIIGQASGIINHFLFITQQNGFANPKPEVF